MADGKATGGAANAGKLTVMAKLALVLIVGLVLLGLVRHGISLENWRRLWSNLFERPEGPMWFRFILQPVMASIAAIKDGIKDAKTGRSPYFWTIVHDRRQRTERLSEGLVATAQIIVIGVIMDTIYQLKALPEYYPGEAVNVALLLAFVPYLLLRGPVARIARRWTAPKVSGSAAGGD
jgi:hypothetical protein